MSSMTAWSTEQVLGQPGLKPCPHTPKKEGRGEGGREGERVGEEKLMRAGVLAWPSHSVHMSVLCPAMYGKDTPTPSQVSDAPSTGILP